MTDSQTAKHEILDLDKLVKQVAESVAREYADLTVSSNATSEALVAESLFNRPDEFIPENFEHFGFYETWRRAFSKLGVTGLVTPPHLDFHEWLWYFYRWSRDFANDYLQFQQAVDEALATIDDEITALNNRDIITSDTATIDFTETAPNGWHGLGSDSNGMYSGVISLKADVKISSVTGNITEAKSDGIYTNDSTQNSILASQTASLSTAESIKDSKQDSELASDADELSNHESRIAQLEQATNPQWVDISSQLIPYNDTSYSVKTLKYAPLDNHGSMVVTYNIQQFDGAWTISADSSDEDSYIFYIDNSPVNVQLPSGSNFVSSVQLSLNTDNGIVRVFGGRAVLRYEPVAEVAGNRWVLNVTSAFNSGVAFNTITEVHSTGQFTYYANNADVQEVNKARDIALSKLEI